MAALFWASPLRLSEEAWALYPTWMKGLAAMRNQLLAGFMADLDIGRTQAWTHLREIGFPVE